MAIMSRTNIDLPDDLVERAMQMYHLASKREAVALALQRLVGEPMSREETLAMEGSGFDLDLEDLRPGWEPPEW
jgi:Arc/MetJ family transcription regulator